MTVVALARTPARLVSGCSGARPIRRPTRDSSVRDADAARSSAIRRLFPDLGRVSAETRMYPTVVH